MNKDELDPDLQFYNSQLKLDKNQKYLIEDEFNRYYSTKTEYLSLIHYNARSLSKNFNKILCHLELLKHQFSFIGVSETWLHDNLTDFYNLDNYKIETVSRKCRQGGGVAIYIRDVFDYIIRNDLGIDDDNICQSLFLETELNKKGSYRHYLQAT